MELLLKQVPDWRNHNLLQIELPLAVELVEDLLLALEVRPLDPNSCRLPRRKTALLENRVPHRCDFIDQFLAPRVIWVEKKLRHRIITAWAKELDQ
jgi:hypothetical protein